MTQALAKLDQRKRQPPRMADLEGGVLLDDGDPLNDPPEVRAAIKAGAGELRVPATAVNRPELVARAASDIEAKKVQWVWPGRVPCGMFSVIDGNPAEGKTSIAASIAAHVTTGRAFPFCPGPAVETSAVLFLAAEDSPEFTLKPRLQAAGANLAKCFISDCTKFNGQDHPIRIPDDLDAIERYVTERGVSVVVVDPLLGFLNVAIDSHKDQSVREALQPLKMLAERTGAAILGLRHPNKSSGGSALMRGMGSIAFTAVARSAMIVGPHPNEDGVRILATTKLNIARVPRSLTYRIEDSGGYPVIRWGEEVDLTADDLGQSLPRNAEGARDEAKDFLRDLLKNGPLPSANVLKAGENAGLKEKTLRRAKDEIGIQAIKSGYANSWLWRLPNQDGQPQDGHEDGQPIPD